MSNETAEEIKSLIHQIESIDAEIKRGIPNFKQAYKNCDMVNEWQGQGLQYPQYLKLVCEKGYGYFKNYIVSPLLIALLDYRDHLTGVKAYTGSYKSKMQGLLSSIHRYVVISSFFGKNIDYIVPGYDKTTREFQQKFKQIILGTNRRLMGCDDNHKFPVQKIAKNVGMEGDHAKILEYMDQQCLFLRKELLK